ncbi:hypothetical protein ACHAAC_05815 [Aeromicrobium sp. CF4.19]|uniref:hypothetical protein n=1 Tax=Aeromicrobium sp. CF4.19 TaxID=3373082 RepID=UPI003EE4FC9D
MDQGEASGETEAQTEAEVASAEPSAAQPAVAKKSAAKKSAAKKSAAKKSAAKKSAAKKTAAKKTAAKKAAGPAPKYPRHTVVQALRIPEAILKQNAGNPTSPDDAVVYAGGSKAIGRWVVEISSAKKYGFLEAEGNDLTLNERARRALVPQAEGDRRNALREAVLSAPDLSDVYNHYRGGSLPDAPFLVNALTDRFKIPEGSVDEFLEIFLDSLQAAELIEEVGDQRRILDAGRETSGRGGSSKTANVSAKVDPGTTCFVMQPFESPLGSYYETVFRPAIEQAGLSAVRADAEIFGTGKIIDQIWRGIQHATVLVAELTTKNPNVFYELGLAHASKKPVILVSSNEDDVPFDLRHIRTIFYDKNDPFWGNKLIDNVADKIKSAVGNPEEAIFDFET